MPEHPFSNLKMGLIERYAKQVPLAEVEQARVKGWLSAMDLGLPKGEEQAYLLYGDPDPCELLMFNRPILLCDTTPTQLQGQLVTSVCFHLGTYGMGGPGFFGIELDEQQFLTYAVWGAGSYVLYNVRVLTNHPSTYSQMRPWVSNFAEHQWDELTEQLVGSRLVSWEFMEHQLQLCFEQQDKLLTLYFVRQDSCIPRIDSNPGIAYESGTIKDYVVLQDSDAVLIV